MLPRPVYSALDTLLREYRVIGVILSVEIAVLCLLAAGLAALAADWLFVLPQGYRFAARALILLASAAALVSVLVLRLRPQSPVNWALCVETLMPKMKGRLATAVELASGSAGVPGGSGKSSAALGYIAAQAQSVIAETGPLEISLAPLRRPALAILALALLSLGWWAAAGGRFERALMRLIAPGAGIPAPTQLTIEKVRPGNVAIRRGDRLEASCIVRGGEPEELFLVIRSAADEIRTPASISPALCAAVSPPLDRSGVYFFEIPGKTKSDEYLVRALAPARITDVRFRVRPPAYTKRETYETGMEPVIIEGSEVEVIVFTDRPAREGRLFLDDEQATMLPSPEGLTAGVYLRRPVSSYTAAFTDVDGFPSEEFPRRPIAVKADRPPEVRILSPLHGDVLRPRSPVPISLEIHDDYGIRRVSIEGFVIDESRPAPVEKKLPRIDAERGVSGNTWFAVVPPEFAPETKGSMTLAAVAADNCPFRFQETSSASVTVAFARPGEDTSGGHEDAPGTGPAADFVDPLRIVELLAVIEELAAARNRAADPRTILEIRKTLSQAASALRSASAASATDNRELSAALAELAALAADETPLPVLREAIEKVRRLLPPDTRRLDPRGTYDVRPAAGDARPPLPPGQTIVEELPDPPGLSPGHRRLMQIYRKLTGAGRPPPER